MEQTGEFQVVFFGGGETRNDRFNVFTGSFIRLLSEIFGEKFRFIKGIYFRSPMFNVIWALNNAQKPLINPGKNKITAAAYNQILETGKLNDTTLIILSSSSGGIVAAQTACYIAESVLTKEHSLKPFHIAIGTSIISKKSKLYLKLLEYQRMGIIGTIIFDELHDKDDSINETGGISRSEAYSNAFGLMFPFFSSKFDRPSFLNTHPRKGHLHRRRSQTLRKALDFFEIILIRHSLAGNHYKEKAKSVISDQN